MAGRPVGMVGAGEVGHVLLLPRPARQVVGRRRYIGGVMQPAIPLRRHARGLGHTVVHHPTLATTAGDLTLVLVIAIAFGIGADQFAAHLGEQPRADSHEPTTLRRGTRRLYARPRKRATRGDRADPLRRSSTCDSRSIPCLLPACII